MEDQLNKIEEELRTIRERNVRVEADKAWETSLLGKHTNIPIMQMIQMATNKTYEFIQSPASSYRFSRFPPSNAGGLIPAFKDNICESAPLYLGKVEQRKI